MRIITVKSNFKTDDYSVPTTTRVKLAVQQLASNASPGGEGDSTIKKGGVLVVSLRGLNFRFWSRLGC